MDFHWNDDKDALLRKERAVGFADVVQALSQDKLLATMPHPNTARYPNQSIYVIEIMGYAYLVPHVQEQDGIFLKTIIPSRKATRFYLYRSEL